MPTAPPRFSKSSGIMNDRLTSPRSGNRRIGVCFISAVFACLLLAGHPAEAGRASQDTKKKQEKPASKEKESGSVEADEGGEELFLREGKENQKFLPDIYRCPECGYEQDEPGTCPDHDESALVLVRSKGKNPLEPSDVDGNEDIVVDIPLTGLSIKKAAPASGTVSPAPTSRAEEGRKEEGVPQDR
ncbi:MAG: hypothetical protein BWY59_02276 [Verrucomicrobia bacterium ADurb.Bin345]|nr:MAG: hypothetical protein BWY59_02276 [Verrucomicrobia bacterium ADurb.Bin345]